MANGNSGADLVMRNLSLRERLRNTSYKFRKFLGTFETGDSTAALGATLRIKLYNVGLITRLIVRVRTRTAITAQNAALSQKGPFNLLSSIRITDFDGTDRINCSGFNNWLMSCVRRRTAWGFNNESQANVLTNPDVNLVVAANGRLEYFLEIPLCYDETDLRGMLLAQTAVGEVYLTVGTNATLESATDVDAVFVDGETAGAVVVIVTTEDIKLDVWQDYIYPQSLEFIPPLDVSTVYEQIGNINSTDNLAADSEKLISLPNLRSVIGYYTTYVEAGLMAADNVERIRLIANGNNIMEDDNAFSHMFKQREYLNSDLRPGVYWKQFRERPIETALFGNVQIGFTPDTADAGNTKLELGVESFYAKGLALPGIPQGT